MIPTYIAFLSLTIPVLKTEGNLAKGEIEKFNLVESCKNKRKFNEQVVGSRGGYDLIWRHISNDYFKLVGKWPEDHC